MSLRGVDWRFDLLDELIEARGEIVVVETGVSCTCRNGDLYGSTIEREGKPGSWRKLNCPSCQGDGYVYRNARCVRGLVTNVESGKNKKLIESGYAIPGDAVFSPERSEQFIGDFDKVTFQFPEPVNEGQVILRGAAGMDENAQIQTDLEDNEDRLWYVAETAIWCEDEEGHVYNQDVDFEFESRKIRWIGNTPDKGSLYTIKYWGIPEWIVYAHPFIRVDRDRSLGSRVLIRKKHVAFLTGNQAATPAEREAEASAFTKETKI